MLWGQDQLVLSVQYVADGLSCAGEQTLAVAGCSLQ